jgi:hypothetical protein
MRSSLSWLFPARFPPPFEPRGRTAIWLAVAALVLVLALVLVVVLVRRGGPQRPPGSEPGAAGSGVPGVESVACPAATVTVRDAGSLRDALAGARPGDSIWMVDGVYSGRFRVSVAGSAGGPIFLCGGGGAVIDGGGVSGGYGLHLDGASFWRLVGFTVRDVQKGVVADRVQRVVVQGLTVERTGDEGIHLRNFSSDNVVQGNTVRETGRRQAEFGEGVYVGTAESNWCKVSGCRVDASDRNVVRDNRISATTAESVDIKEGTTGGFLVGNTFDGSGLSGSYSDSWVDVKGNGWLIQGNTGRNSRMDGFQTHQVVDGWGRGNVFRANTAVVNGPGWGFNLAPAGNGNTVSCDNKVTGAAKGTATVACS